MPLVTWFPVPRAAAETPRPRTGLSEVHRPRAGGSPLSEHEDARGPGAGEGSPTPSCSTLGPRPCGTRGRGGACADGGAGPAAGGREAAGLWGQRGRGGVGRRGAENVPVQGPPGGSAPSRSLSVRAALPPSPARARPRPQPGSGVRPPHDRSGRARPSGLRKAPLARSGLLPPPGAPPEDGGARGRAGLGAAQCWAPRFRRPSGPKPAQRSPSLGAPGQGEQSAPQRKNSRTGSNCPLARGSYAAGDGARAPGEGPPARALQNPLACRCCGQGPLHRPSTPLLPVQGQPCHSLGWEQQDPHHSRADVRKSRGQCPDHGADSCPTVACFPTRRKVPKLGVGSNCAGPFRPPRGKGGDGGREVSQAEGTTGEGDFT